MKILTLSYEFPPIGGGGSGVVKGLATELVSKGHHIDVVTMGFSGLPVYEEVAGIRVHRVDCGRASESKCTAVEAYRYVSRAKGVVDRLVVANEYDLAHVHFIFPDGVLALRALAPRNIPYVLTAHGSDVAGYNVKPFFRIMHKLLTGLWRRVTRASAGIVSPSRTLANLIEASGPGVPVDVIPNGFDPDKFRPAQKKEQILVATRLVRRKGVQYFLKALGRIDNNFSKIVVGSGEFQGELLRLNEELGEPAEFVGWLDNESDRFRKLLEESAIYVLPSDFENFPVCLLEAMAAGTAIITTSGHGCEEVVGDCAAFVVPGADNEEGCVQGIADTLDRLCTDNEYRVALASSARKRLDDNFTWAAVAMQYEEIFARAVA